MIYVLFTCDTHKSWDSMRMIGASTNLLKIKKQLKQMLNEGDVEFNQDPEDFNPKDNWRVYDLNSQFDYVHIEEVEDGEFI